MLEHAHQVRLIVPIGILPMEVTNNQAESSEVNIIQPTCLRFISEIDPFSPPDLE